MARKAGTLVRIARQAAGATQRVLAERSGVAQPNIASLESELGRDATVDSVERLLQAAGAQLAVLPTRSPTVADVALEVRRHLATGATRHAYRTVIGLHDVLVRADPATRVALAVTPAPSTADRNWDALIAAVVEHDLARLPKPAWLTERRRVADGWYVDEAPALAEHIRSRTPAAFRRHGVWLDETELASV